MGGWWWGGWRVHGVDGWVIGWLVGGFMEWVVVGWVVGGFIGWVHTHPSMNNYNVKRFHFMNTHPPIKHIQSVTLSLYMYFGWFMGWEVGGDGVAEGFMGWVVVGWLVGGFMGWVGVWWWGRLLEGSLGGCIYSPTCEQLQC